MTTYIVLAVVLLALALATVQAIRDWRRSGRAFCTPLPRPYRDRESQEAAWRQRYGERANEADIVLNLICEAFGFNPDDRYKFSPDDHITDIYRACYPRWKLWQPADNMEIESLMMDLEDRFGLEVEAWLWETSLGEVVQRGAAKKADGGTGSLQ